jgi:hypothetical protein
MGVGLTGAERAKEPQGAMTVFIRRCPDRCFLKAEHVWVRSLQEAKAFPCCTPALDFCVKHRLRNVQLWLSFGDSEYDFPMEVVWMETTAFSRYNKELHERERRVTAEQARLGVRLE